MINAVSIKLVRDFFDLPFLELGGGGFEKLFALVNGLECVGEGAAYGEGDE